MKTAISLPDTLFNQAEELAHRLGIARSQLFAKALSEYLEKYRTNQITDKLNKIYLHDREDSLKADVSLTALRDLTQNDTW